MMEEKEAFENDPILQELRETRCQRLLRSIKNISSCFLNPDFLISQAFCIFFYGSFGAITPYLPLYLKQYNLATYQVGIILGLSPIIQCLVSPVWSALAGKWHAQKLVFLAGVMSVLVKLLLFLAVQPQRQHCTESYINSTSNLTYERSTPYSDLIKGKVGEWKANIPTKAPSTNKPIELTTPSVLIKRVMNPNEEQSLNVDDYPDLSSLPHQSRHLLELQPLVIFEGLEPFRVVIKNSSNWDSHVNATVTSTITGDKDEVFNIFLIFVLFVVVCDFLQASTFGLGDGSVLKRLEENFRSSPTTVHFVGALGWAGTAMVVGAIIFGSYTIHCGSPYVVYATAFYFSIGFVSMAFIQALWFEYVYDKTSDTGCETWKKSCKIFGTIKNSVFIVCLLYVSLCAGFLGSFLNWYIDDLGGSALVMATASATRVIVTFIFYQIAKVLVPILGRANVSVVALMCYTTCFFCYWLAKNTWEIVAIVAIEGASFGLAWRSCDYFVSRLRASPNVITVTKGIMEAVFWGAGQGLGILIGGAMYGWLGRATFLVIGIATVVVILLSLLALLYNNSQNINQEDFDQDLGDYEILEDDKSKIRYDGYDDERNHDESSKHHDGDDKKITGTAAEDDGDEFSDKRHDEKKNAADDYDDYEVMDDDNKSHDDDEQKRKHAAAADDDDDDYEEMEDRSSENDHGQLKEHDDGDYFKFASPDDSKQDSGSDSELHKRRPEDHKQNITEYY